MKVKIVVLLIAAMAWAAPALAQRRVQAMGYAERSFAATYFEHRTQSLAGTVVDVTFRPERSFVHIEALDEKGLTHLWALEWRPDTLLFRQGLTLGTLRPGDRVVVTGHPDRYPDVHRLWLVAISRPFDGWTWGRTVTP